MAIRSENLAPLIPVRTIESQQADDGKVTITEPREDPTWLGKLLSKGLEPGTKHSVRDIAGIVAERFGADFDPESKRLAVFMLTMKQRGWLVWKEG
jgi:hypothetical protein